MTKQTNANRAANQADDLNALCCAVGRAISMIRIAEDVAAEICNADRDVDRVEIANKVETMHVAILGQLNDIMRKVEAMHASCCGSS